MDRPLVAEMIAEKSTCIGCRFALWERTRSGRLHPDGNGTCEWRPTAVPVAGRVVCMSMIINRHTASLRPCPVRELA